MNYDWQCTYMELQAAFLFADDNCAPDDCNVCTVKSLCCLLRIPVIHEAKFRLNLLVYNAL